MKTSIICILIAASLACPGAEVQAAKATPSDNGTSLPPVETLVMEPIQVQRIDVWAPADKVGPLVNRACKNQTDCHYQCRLATDIRHTKSDGCPRQTARALAEYVWPMYKESLPLTLTNGWRWSFPFTFSSYEGCEYTLPRWGGSWENSVEAVLCLAWGSVQGHWLNVSSPDPAIERMTASEPQRSDLTMKTYSSIKARNGYPKERMLSRNP